MLKYVMLKETDNHVDYKYIPEGKEYAGVISYCKSNGAFSIVNLAESDTFRKYAFKMIRRIKQFAVDGEFRKEGIVAWY